MASIYKEIDIEACPDDVWAALRDFGAVHQLLVPGFVTESKLEGDDVRVVTFFNGAVAREILVGIDDDNRRLVYSVVEGPFEMTHHNASAQVIATDGGTTRFVWITDVLPHETAERIDELMGYGIGVIKQTLERE